MNDAGTVGSTTREWLRAIMTQRSLNLPDVEKQTGVAASTVSRILDGTIGQPRRETVARLSRLSGDTIPSSLRDYLDARPFASHEHNMNSTSEGETGIQVWGVIPDLINRSFFRLNPYAAAHLGRADLLRLNPKLIAFYAPDDSMAPRWRSGEPVIVDLLRSARLNEPALIEVSDTNQNGSELRLLRMLTARKNGHWHLDALDGSEQITLPQQRVLAVKHVLDWRELVI